MWRSSSRYNLVSYRIVSYDIVGTCSRLRRNCRPNCRITSDWINPQVAKKPIFYVGQGAVGGKEELRALAKKCNVPVTTTLHAMGIVVSSNCSKFV